MYIFLIHTTHQSSRIKTLTDSVKLFTLEGIQQHDMRVIPNNLFVPSFCLRCKWKWICTGTPALDMFSRYYLKSNHFWLSNWSWCSVCWMIGGWIGWSVDRSVGGVLCCLMFGLAFVKFNLCYWFCLLPNVSFCILWFFIYCHLHF